MKKKSHQSKKYEHLVEAQSPEPQERMAMAMAMAPSSSELPLQKQLMDYDNKIEKCDKDEELLRERTYPGATFNEIDSSKSSDVIHIIASGGDSSSSSSSKSPSTKMEYIKGDSRDRGHAFQDKMMEDDVPGQHSESNRSIPVKSAKSPAQATINNHQNNNVVVNIEDQNSERKQEQQESFCDTSQELTSSTNSTASCNNSIDNHHPMASTSSYCSVSSTSLDLTAIQIPDKTMCHKLQDNDIELDSFRRQELSRKDARKSATSSLLNLSSQQSNNKSVATTTTTTTITTTTIKPFEIVWKNLSFSYSSGSNLLRKCVKQKPFNVLKDISGRFSSNQLVAVIGPSGCGKTTLLQFLAGNNANCKNKLRIIGLDEPKVAFIGQDDGLLPGLTARETLVYASRLQNTEFGFDHQQHVKPIIAALGLSECADRRITKLSGGQTKRVIIGQELLYPTNLLILDEVTSGLDASTSYSIVKLLKDLVSDRENPMSIVISIHQPSARLFSVFDKVYVMSAGHCIYEGSCRVDLVNEYLSHFNLQCPQFHNIADYLIEIATESKSSSSNSSSSSSLTNNSSTNIANDDLRVEHLLATREKMIEYQRGRYLSSGFEEDDGSANGTIIAKYFNQAKSSPSNSTNKKDLEFKERNLIEADNISEQQDKEFALLINKSSSISSPLYDAIELARSRRSRPLMSQLLIHLNRSTLRISRSSILTYLQLFTYIILGLQLSTFYGSDIGTLSGCPQLPVSLMAYVLSNDNKSDDDAISQEMRRIQENMNFLLVAIMTATFAALEITVITFPMEAKTIKREWRNGWYRVSSYFLGRTLADLPFQLTFVVVFCVIIYTLTGQVGLTSWRFGSFVLVIIMTALVAQTVGFIFGAIFMNNLPAAVFTAPLFIFPALLFSGFFSRVSQVPAFYKPMTYLSHFRYAFDALIVTLYGFDRCQCDQETLTYYHANLNNQTSSIKDMVQALFGSSDCIKQQSTKASRQGTFPTDYPNEDENSIEDTPTTINPEHLVKNLNNNSSETFFPTTTTTTTSATANASLATHFKSFEDTLVDTVFEHMVGGSNSTSKTTMMPGIFPANNGTLSSTQASPSSYSSDVTDVLAQRFSTKITKMLNSQANFGHQMPTECRNFNPYLMTEFDMHNEDLLNGLLWLFVYVIMTRLLCNLILSFTIASRVR